MTGVLDVADDDSQLYFSDHFGLDPKVVADYGAFDISLTNDLPLFIDPFLLFNSEKPDYQALHRGIIEYLRFLRDKAIEGPLSKGELEAWFTFHEVKQNWFGVTVEGNDGRGLGPDFARHLSRALGTRFRDFGKEKISRASHLEKLCLIKDGVGKDNISDLSTNLLKKFLLRYTEEFAVTFLDENQRKKFIIPKVSFSYETRSWTTRTFELPNVNGEYVILTPIDLLTKDEAWINRGDMVRGFENVVGSVSNVQLRAQLNDYFGSTLDSIVRRDKPDRPRKSRRGRVADDQPSFRQRSEAVDRVIDRFPEIIDYYIRTKEDSGDLAELESLKKVSASAFQFVAQVKALVGLLKSQTSFFGSDGNTLEEARDRVSFLKDVIENKGGWRSFWSGDDPIGREGDLQVMFRLTWRGSRSDVNREVNNGRGPSDFEISRGSRDKTIVEFKLARNSALRKNLQYQTEAYQKASDAQNALKVVLYFTLEEKTRVLAILSELRLEGNRDVVLIDARRDNKQSASRIDSESTDDAS